MSRQYSAERALSRGERTVGSASVGVDEALRRLTSLALIERTTSRHHYRVDGGELGSLVLGTLDINPDVLPAEKGNWSRQPLVRVGNMVSAVEVNSKSVDELVRTLQKRAREEGWPRRTSTDTLPLWNGG